MLSDAERQELVVFLTGVNGSAHEVSAECEFETRLAAERWLTLPAPPPANSQPFQLAAPLVTQGRPLSEILVEERR